MRPVMTRTRALGMVLLSALVSPFGRELFCGDETKYSEVVREMRATGEWFLPPLEGVPFTHKPPLHFWIVDLLTFVFGTYSVWSFVLPSLIAFVLLIWLMHKMAGPVAAFVCATSLLIWGSAQTARMDVTFTLLITFAIWRIARFLDDGQSRALAVAGIALGIATLIKGPMAPVIAIVFFALECWRRHRVPRGNYFPGLVAMIALPLLWFIPAMSLGGGAYTHEVLQKQLAGRAIGAWVHQSPPWFYLLHSPVFLFPWFAALVAALIARWRDERLAINWILAVLVPYSLMSSKLDVYMMALIPPVAFIVARSIDRTRIANAITLAVLLLVAIAGPFIKIKDTPPLTSVFVVLGITSAVALIVSFLGMARTFSPRPFDPTERGLQVRATPRDDAAGLPSTIALGFVPIVVLVFIALTKMPLINDLATPRPLIAALEKQHVPGETIALYTCPHLWSHDMPRDLEHVHYASPQTLLASNPAVIATARAHSGELGTQLAPFHRVDSVRMIGKWFDVYRR
jgi:4-amino-4-deoxy-L-arabinose transferase-like glycosyltransferase